jgi:hypothetical protein
MAMTTYHQRSILKIKKPEPLFLNVYGAQESIPPGWESTPGLLQKFTNTGSGEVLIHH